MSFQIIKQPRENSQALIRRFLKRLRQSGILYRAKKSRYKERPLSEQLKKRAALRREELKKEYERKVKMGEIKQ